MNQTYNIVMFAYNEAHNIANSIRSIHTSVGKHLGQFFVIANGCTDNTAAVAEKIKRDLDFTQMHVIDIAIGDKCNAWNTYIHEYSGDYALHFFVDADVIFSENVFEQLYAKSQSALPETNAIAGLPLSGRNKDFYESLVKERHCIFGNLYGLTYRMINLIKSKSFRLPKGLNWIDSFITKAINTDLQFHPYNLENRVTYLQNAGYRFDSLSMFKLNDVKLYKNRIARYELGKLQEQYLDALPVSDWPQDMDEINKDIDLKFQDITKDLTYIKTWLVKKRLSKLINHIT
jgi:glycosyltransferase involved in cell wall biosynthesis